MTNEEMGEKVKRNFMQERCVVRCFHHRRRMTDSVDELKRVNGKSGIWLDFVAAPNLPVKV
jgi:hypothetical protein